MTPRRVARGLLVTRDGRILLLKAREPATGREFWFPPGGGIEQGETDLEGLRRELFEETGLANPAVGPAVWARTADFFWDNRRIVEDEVYWLVPVERFEPTMSRNPAEYEKRWFGGFRWWTADEMAASGCNFAPRSLADLIKDLRANGPPPGPGLRQVD